MNDNGTMPPQRDLSVQDMMQRRSTATYTPDLRKIGPDGLPRVQAAADFRTECLERTIPDVSKGWVRDHYAFCNHGKILARGAAQVSADILILGVGSANSREVNFHVEISNVKPLQDPTANPVVRFSVDCSSLNAQPSNSCQPSANSTVARNATEWNLNPEVDFTITSPEVGEGPEKVVVAGWAMKIDVPSSGDDPVELKGYSRFDSATYMKRGAQKGAIFNAVIPSFPLDGTDPNIAESVKHISDACNRPWLTSPAVANKVVAGCSRTNIMHRLKHDTSRRRANRAAAIAQCRTDDPNYVTSAGYRRDCDEYPFSCTYEGAAQPRYDTNVRPGMFSARPITASDNRTSGSRLGAWYSSDRILDWRSAVTWTDPVTDEEKRIDDPFFIRITDDPNAQMPALPQILAQAQADEEDGDRLDCNGE